jgi:ribosome-associated translation inhibitor RaiA
VPTVGENAHRLRGHGRVQISYHGLEPSQSLSELIRMRAAQLERISERIHSLRVLVDAPHRHHRQGNHYRVRVEVTVPGHDIVVGHDDETRSGDEDAFQAVCCLGRPRVFAPDAEETNEPGAGG